MTALVIYESMYGNTHAVAEAVATGLRTGHVTTVVAAANLSPGLLYGSDLIVVGSPTHAHGLPRPSTRRSAAEAATAASGLRLDGTANDPGIREWLTALGRLTVPAAAFDTRVDWSPVLTGRASKHIARQLERAGAKFLAAPESFLVTKANQLLPGELARAEQWGQHLGALVAARHAAGTQVAPVRDAGVP